jgi:hypothetical protein
MRRWSADRSKKAGYPMNRRVLTAVLLTAIACVLPASAEGSDPMVTDRPDATESSSIVPRGLFQFEVGWTHTENDEGGVEFENDAAPEVLLRAGLSERIELRVGFGGYQWAETTIAGGGSIDGEGAADSSLGIKLRLATEQGGRPEMALIGAVSLPTGDDLFTTDEVDPAFRLTFSNTLSDRLSLGYNVGAAWASETDGGGDEDRLARAEWTAALGIGATDRLSFFVELFGDAALSAHGSARTLIDGGATYLLRENVQFDLFVGSGLSDAAEDWFGGVGISFRLPR